MVQLQIVHQCNPQIGTAIEARLLQQLVDAAVEALDHAVRLRVAQWRQAVLGRQCGASHVERVLAAWLFAFGNETIRQIASYCRSGSY